MFYTFRPIVPRRNRNSKTWRKDVLLLDRSRKTWRDVQDRETRERERETCAFCQTRLLYRMARQRPRCQGHFCLHFTRVGCISSPSAFYQSRLLCVIRSQRCQEHQFSICILPEQVALRDTESALPGTSIFHLHFTRVGCFA